MLNILAPGQMFEEMNVSRAILIFIAMALFATLLMAVTTVALTDFSELDDGALTPNQADTVIMISKVLGAVFSVVGIFIGWAFMSLILWALVRWLGGQGTYASALAVTGLAWIPLFLYSLGLAGFMAGSGFVPGQGNLILWTLWEHLNPFVIWNISLLTIGFSTIFKISLTSSLAAVISYRVVLFLFAMAATLFTSMLDDLMMLI